MAEHRFKDISPPTGITTFEPDIINPTISASRDSAIGRKSSRNPQQTKYFTMFTSQLKYFGARIIRDERALTFWRID